MSSWWATINPVIADGEIALDRDTHQFKVGDGVTPWHDLSYYLTGPQGPQGPIGNGSVYNRELSGEMDGVNKVFHTPSAFIASTTRIYKDRLRLILNEDYIETGANEVTLLCILRPTTTLRIDYDPQNTITT